MPASRQIIIPTEPPVRNLIFTSIAGIRRNYWFWPTAMTVLAIVLGFVFPFMDALLGAEWTRNIGFVRATQVDGARAILTTLAGASLGVAGVAFSITIVAVSFASSNFGPRLIGNFMADRTNQIVLGVFVATFVYCITVLSTVHARVELEDSTLQAFVPQISTLFAIVLTLASVGALIGYIHHIPESINVMNLTAAIGNKLRVAIAASEDEAQARVGAEMRTALVPWPDTGDRSVTGHAVRTRKAGYLQRVDLDELRKLADAEGVRIRIDRGAGDFLGVGEAVMTVLEAHGLEDGFATRLQRSYTLGSNRTDDQDILFLADQLVEVAVRALSPGVNDPHTAMLCLDWLGAALCAFSSRPPATPLPDDAPVLYGQLSFETMLDRTCDQMRQHVCADRTVTLYMLGILGNTGAGARTPAMAAACVRQIGRFAMSANEQLSETLAREEVEAARTRALAAVTLREGGTFGGVSP